MRIAERKRDMFRIKNKALTFVRTFFSCCKIVFRWLPWIGRQGTVQSDFNFIVVEDNLFDKTFNEELCLQLQCLQVKLSHGVLGNFDRKFFFRPVSVVRAPTVFLRVHATACLWYWKERLVRCRQRGFEAHDRPASFLSESCSVRNSVPPVSLGRA